MISKATATAAPRPLLASDLKFPAMPQTLTEIMRLRSQGTPDVEQLVEIVKKDPGIAAGVLRRVNSAYYGVSRKIVQIDKAVGLLGYKEVYGLALAAVVKQAFAFRGSEEAGAVYRHIMRHSLATAAMAKILADQLSPIATETTFTAGLLHQVGRLVLLSSIPKPYTDLWLRISPTHDLDNLVSPTPAMERFVLRNDHTQIGSQVAQQWGLPEEILAAIRSYTDAEGVQAPYLRSLTLMVATGSAVAAELFEPVTRTETLASLIGALQEARSVKHNTITVILDERREEVRRFAESMMQE